MGSVTEELNVYFYFILFNLNLSSPKRLSATTLGSTNTEHFCYCRKFLLICTVLKGQLSLREIIRVNSVQIQKAGKKRFTSEALPFEAVVSKGAVDGRRARVIHQEGGWRADRWGAWTSDASETPHPLGAGPTAGGKEVLQTGERSIPRSEWDLGDRIYVAIE